MRKTILFVFLIFTNSIFAQVANQPSDLVVCDDNNRTPTVSFPNNTNDGLECFDLSQKNAEVLGTQNPADYSITYHLSQVDADTNSSALPVPFCNTSNPQTIYVRLESIATGNYDTTNFTVSVIPSPVVPDAVEIFLFRCDEPFSLDGLSTFDLSFNAPFIYGSQSTTDFRLDYFETEADAYTDINPITNLTSYTSITPGQFIYVRLTNVNTDCYTVGFFYLEVNAPLNDLVVPDALSVCDVNQDETAIFDLTSRALDVTNGDTSIQLQYFASQSDFINDIPIANPSTYQNTINPQIVYVRSVRPSNLPFECPSTVELTLSVLPSPSPVLNPTPIVGCADSTTGIIFVDLTSRETEILNGEANVTISYHETAEDSWMGTNPIADPTLYAANIANANTSGEVIIYVRVASDLQAGSDTLPCFTSVSLPILINSLPNFTTTAFEYVSCGNGTNTTETYNWDTVTNSLNLFVAPQEINDFSISYHSTEADALANINPLADGFQNTSNPQTVYIRAENTATSCSGLESVSSLTLLVEPFPTINLNPTPMEDCNPSGNGLGTFLISTKINEIANGTSVAITFHETVDDAQNDVNTLPNLYNNAIPFSQTLYVRAESVTGCFEIITLDLIVTSSCLPTAAISPAYICDDDDDGLVCVDLTSKASEAIGTLNPNDLIITYYLSELDTFNETNAIANPMTFCTTQVSNTVYIRIEDIVSGVAAARTFILEGVVVQAVAPTPLEACDDDGNGIASFSLNTKVDEIVGGNPEYEVKFYLSQSDADLEQYEIVTSFINSTPYTQTVYARVAPTLSLYAAANCYEIVPVTLVATPTACNPIATNTVYDVQTIPYQLYDINTLTTTTNIDDTFTSVIDLSFNFDYFEQTYTQITIGTNGVISFNTSIADSYCDWQIEAGNMLPNSNLFLNTIFGVYHDLYDDDPNSGTLGYAVIGQAPYRKMVVFFDQINQFSSGACPDPSTMQIILHETFNIIDVQINEKIACTTWNEGHAIVGIQNATGDVAYFPQDRNNGVWDAFNEGHRFYPQSDYENEHVVLCDDDMDGFLEFDLSTIEAQMLGDITNGTVTYFSSEQDLVNNTNSLPMLYTNVSNAQLIYANVLNTTTNETMIKTVTLAVIDCTLDVDSDGVATMDEDVNGDGNLGNDDTDGDGIPDFADEDDDGDYVLTNVELISTAGFAETGNFLDTDNDMIPNHRDDDDDGDGVLTIDEDYNENNNPEDDDTNNNNIPDYLDDTVAILGVQEVAFVDVVLYPNPAKDKLTIAVQNNVKVKTIAIYSIEGRLVHAQQSNIQNDKIVMDVSRFAAGFYVLKMQAENNVTFTKRFIIE